MQRALFFLSMLFYISPKLQRQGGSSVVHGEIVEVDVGKASDHVADVLFIVDTSASVGKNYKKMRQSFIELISNFKVGDDGLRIAIIQCHGNVSDPNKLTLLDLKGGNSEKTVTEALRKLVTFQKNPFPACFKAASDRVFVEKYGDRPDAPNIILFTSDADFRDLPFQRAPTEEVKSLKQNGVTIIAISFCNDNLECSETISNNNKIASRPEYNLQMDDFNANNKEIRHALQRSASCKQKVELAECAWVNSTSCERNIIPEENFSNKICEKSANKSNLITQASAEDSKNCATVNKITYNISCVLDDVQKCRVRNFKIEHRAKNQFDDARSGDPIADDFKACGLTEPKGEACPESVCQAADCKFGKNFNVESCGNIHLQNNCAKELKARCQGSDDIDVHCYAFYFARNKTSFIEEMHVTWANGIPVVTKVEKKLKDLCENNSLRHNCSKWMTDKFDANLKNICSNVGSTIAVECLKDPASAVCSNNTGNFTKEQACDELCTSKDPNTYIQCIEEKQKLWYTHNNATYPCKKHISDLKILTGISTVEPPNAVTKSSTVGEQKINGTVGDNENLAKEKPGDAEKWSSKGLIIGVVIALLILVILTLVIIVLLVRRKKKKASEPKHFSVPTKEAGANSVGLATDLDETSQVGSTRSRPNKSVVSTKSKTTKSVVSTKSKTTKSAASKSKTAKSRTSAAASKQKEGKYSAKNNPKIAKIDSTTKGKGPAIKNAKIKSPKFPNSKK